MRIYFSFNPSNKKNRFLFFVLTFVFLFSNPIFFIQKNYSMEMDGKTKKFHLKNQMESKKDTKTSFTTPALIRGALFFGAFATTCIAISKKNISHHPHTKKNVIDSASEYISYSNSQKEPSPSSDSTSLILNSFSLDLTIPSISLGFVPEGPYLFSAFLFFPEGEVVTLAYDEDIILSPKRLFFSRKFPSSGIYHLELEYHNSTYISDALIHVPKPYGEVVVQFEAITNIPGLIKVIPISITSSENSNSSNLSIYFTLD